MVFFKYTYVAMTRSQLGKTIGILSAVWIVSTSSINHEKNRGKSLKNRSKNKNYLITQGGVYTTAVQVPSLLKYIKYEHPNLLNYSINKSYITDNDKDNLLSYLEVLRIPCNPYTYARK